jgi:hypothetical protein
MSDERKYVLRIGGNPVGQFRTQEECRDYARDHGGYRYGWSIETSHDGRTVKTYGESAVHQTARIHDEFNGAFSNAAFFLWDASVFLISGLLSLLFIIWIIRSVIGFVWERV